MKKFMTILSMAILILGVASSASALSITPASLEGYSGIVHPPGEPEVYAAITPYVGTINSLYKGEPNAADSGTFAASYESSLGEHGGTITYISGPAIHGNPIWLLVKDGNHDPVWYLFNLSNIVGAGAWNGTETITLSGFWATGGGSISHIEIIGTSTQVPEPLTLILLGLGLTGMAVVRRFKK